MKRVAPGGVLLGAVVDVVGSLVFGFSFAIAAVIILHHFHVPHAVVLRSVTLCAIEVLIGLGFSVLGGYVAAWVAKHDELLNGCLASFLCVAWGAWTFATEHESTSLWWQLLLLIAGPVFSLLGGYLRLRKSRGRDHYSI
jgi:hypothetical protein